MPNGMLGDLLLSEVQGPRDDFETKLASQDGKWWLHEFKKFLRKEATWISQLLEQVITFDLPYINLFRASGKFKVGVTDGVKIGWLDGKFKDKFLKKVERDVASATIRVHRLVEKSLDQPILTELGADHKTQLAHLWGALKRQPNGEAGPLLTNGCANIFYICGTDGKVWAVDARWDAGDGWYVDASSVDNPGKWDDGNQVFSR